MGSVGASMDEKSLSLLVVGLVFVFGWLFWFSWKCKLDNERSVHRKMEEEKTERD